MPAARSRHAFRFRSDFSARVTWRRSARRALDPARSTEHIDTTTPAGRMMMQMVGVFADFERAMIRERTSAGLAAARAEGRIGGRRKKLDETKRREIAEAVVSGRKTAAQMARMFGISQPTVSLIVAAYVAGHS